MLRAVIHVSPDAALQEPEQEQGFARTQPDMENWYVTRLRRETLPAKDGRHRGDGLCRAMRACFLAMSVSPVGCL